LQGWLVDVPNAIVQKTASVLLGRVRNPRFPAESAPMKIDRDTRTGRRERV